MEQITISKILDWLPARDTAATTNPTISIGLLVLRVGIGLLMAFSHGWGKLLNYSERAAQFPDPLGVGNELSLGLTVFAEFFCPLAIALGLATRAAVVPLIITMWVAALVIHGDDPWGRKELAMLYVWPCLTILIAGPGRYSIDRLFGRR